jgi:hypothetical protein
MIIQNVSFEEAQIAATLVAGWVANGGKQIDDHVIVIEELLHYAADTLTNWKDQHQVDVEP